MRLVEIPKFSMACKMIHYNKYFPNGWELEDTLTEIHDSDGYVIGLILWTTHGNNAYNVHIHHFGADFFTFGKGLLEFCRLGEYTFNEINVECIIGTPFERMLIKRGWTPREASVPERIFYDYRRKKSWVGSETNLPRV